jgi:hypothetical protein
MHNRNKIYQEFEKQVDELIRAKNKSLIDAEALGQSVDKFNPRNTPLYREIEGYRNGLVYAKQILRDIIHDANRGKISLDDFQPREQVAREYMHKHPHPGWGTGQSLANYCWATYYDCHYFYVPTDQDAIEYLRPKLGNDLSIDGLLMGPNGLVDMTDKGLSGQS